VGENRRVFRQYDLGFAVEHLAREPILFGERAAAILNCSQSNIRSRSKNSALPQEFSPTAMRVFEFFSDSVRGHDLRRRIVE